MSTSVDDVVAMSTVLLAISGKVFKTFTAVVNFDRDLSSDAINTEYGARN